MKTRRAKRAGKLWGHLLKYKGNANKNPAREARWGIFGDIHQRCKGTADKNPAREARREILEGIH